MKAATKTIAAQDSWVIRNDQVELAVTMLGGHMAPVTFFRKQRKGVQPYYISPWQTEKLKLPEPVLVPLRGDFLCMPFGANGVVRGVKHVVHGEVAGRRWTFAALETSDSLTRLTLAMKTRALPGLVHKHLTLVDGQNAVYIQHVLEGFPATAVPLGHHAILAVPDKPGSLRLSTSPLRLGMTNPVLDGDPAAGSYSCLAPNRRFKDLAKVPTIWKDQPTADLTSYPGRTGFTDILAVFQRPAKTPAWTAVAAEDQGFLWYSLKDASVLPATALWVGNRGRHGAPWNGRNQCLGVEDVCGYFAMGLEPSAKPNALTRAGIPTTIKLSPTKPTVINHIQGCVRIAKGFGLVKDAVFGPDSVRFVSTTGKTAIARVRPGFLQSGAL